MGYLRIAASPPKPSSNCEPSSVSVEINDIIELPFEAIIVNSSINETFEIPGNDAT